MKFLCLAYEEERKLNELSPSEWESLRTETLAYVDSLRATGHLLDARPLGSATRASTLRKRDGMLSITDGPFAETKEQIGGYFLIEVADREEALRLAAGWPSARIGSIEVRPVDEELSVDRRYG
jgi:hypothetical protein